MAVCLSKSLKVCSSEVCDSVCFHLLPSRRCREILKFKGKFPVVRVLLSLSNISLYCLPLNFAYLDCMIQPTQASYVIMKRTKETESSDDTLLRYWEINWERISDDTSAVAHS